VFWIRDILRWIWIIGSVHRITDPIQDPDQDPVPAFSLVAFKMPTNNKIFSNFFIIITFCSVCTFTSVVKDNKSLRTRKTVEIQSFLIFLLVDERIRTDPGPVQIITDTDPDSGGTKTYGSYGSGTLVLTYSEYLAG
jgi:hypothetical protein